MVYVVAIVIAVVNAIVLLRVADKIVDVNDHDIHTIV